jgi:hypothetical protein
MSRPEEERLDAAARATGRDLWRRACATEITAEETERFLDLAAFADGRLDTDEAERIAALVASVPGTAADIATAQSLSTGDGAGAAPERVIERALRLVPPQAERGRVIAFPRHRWPRRALGRTAQWGSLAAAIVLAGWLGFSMGSNTLLALSEGQTAQSSDDATLPDLLDPATTGFLHELTRGLRT